MPLPHFVLHSDHSPQVLHLPGTKKAKKKRKELRCDNKSNSHFHAKILNLKIHFGGLPRKEQTNQRLIRELIVNVILEMRNKPKFRTLFFLNFNNRTDE